MSDSNKDLQSIQNLQSQFYNLKNEISKVIVGQEKVVEELITSIFCKGHVLLVGVPGLAKTLLVKTISESLGLGFSPNAGDTLVFVT